MNNQVKFFRELHQQDAPLLLGNVWNAQSAKIMEKLKFKALATSSAAVAETLGYKDGENMPFEEYYFVIKRIKKSVETPLSVDVEAGYGKTSEEIVKNLKLLHDLGVAGINLEDSVVINSVREIVNEESFAQKLTGIRSQLERNNIDIFINVRCDAFLLNLPDSRKEAMKRIGIYEKAGADGIFLPCITDIADIKANVNSTTLPVNVMCMPDLPDFDALKSAGVKRISMGNFVNGSVYNKFEELSGKIQKEGNFSCLF